MDKSKLGNKIKNIRDINNMSQYSFGKKIGVTGKTISAYETGKCIPPLKVLERITDVYKVSLVHIDEAKKHSMNEKLMAIKLYIDEIEDTLSESISL